MRWAQGEHVVAIGTTGSGKTEVIVRLLERRRWNIFLGTKKRDETQDRLRKMGYKTIPDARLIEPELYRRIIVRPPFPRNASAEQLENLHKEVFRATLMRAFNQECWTITYDEIRYICDFLGLKKETLLLMLQGRSQDNTVVAGTQRPFWVPREVLDQSTHAFLWRPTDEADIPRMYEVAGAHRAFLEAAFPIMKRHDVVYVNLHEPGRAFLTNTRWK